MSSTRFLCLAALCGAVSCHAHATVTGLRWVEVDNTIVDPASDPVAGAAWLANPAGWRTFDLMVLGDPGTNIGGWYFGSPLFPDLDDFVIYTDGEIFQHPAGGNLPRNDGPIYDFATLLQFDTYMTINGQTEMSLVPSFGGTDLSDGIAGLRGGVQVLPPEPIGASGLSQLLRITLSADFTYLGNYNAPDGLVSQAYLISDGVSLPFLLPTEIPAPSAAAVLTLAGVGFVRRRR